MGGPCVWPPPGHGIAMGARAKFIMHPNAVEFKFRIAACDLRMYASTIDRRVF
jgi:hypothetical protein